MRTECQEAEVALSYLRRLVQGRLDIVHAFLDRPEGGAAPDLASLVDDLPGILSSGPRPSVRTRPPADAALSRHRGVRAHRGARRRSSAPTTSARSPTSTTTSSAIWPIASATSSEPDLVDRRALHERIDTLQAELVERHKSGSASVDGLLS